MRSILLFSINQGKTFIALHHFNGRFTTCVPPFTNYSRYIIQIVTICIALITDMKDKRSFTKPHLPVDTTVTTSDLIKLSMRKYWKSYQA